MPNKAKSSIKRMLAALLSGLMAVGALTLSAVADEPYDGYNYDWWGDPIPSQNGYVVDKVVNSLDMGLETLLNEPNDMFIYENTGDIYIADSTNNRIVVINSDFDPSSVRIMSEFTFGKDYTPKQSGKASGDTTTLNNPMGVFVLDYHGETLIYIADHSNDRVLACYEDGTVWMEYTKPSSDLYDAEVTFNPKKVLVDNAKNVYVCIKSITQGAVMFAEDGSFSGYYGANRVQQTAEVIANAFWKMIFTREQILRMRRNVSVEFSNFDIDMDGFIYTCTELKSATTDVVKKLNPAGENIFTALGYDMPFGDYITIWFKGKTYSSSICDVEIDSSGNMILLDYTMGRIFQYTDECDLLFTFGGKGDQKGLFTSPTALESYKGKIYVLDGRKNTITIYKLTEFGELVQKAMALLNDGKWIEGLEPWQDVLEWDSNYWYAYIGIGQAYLNNGDFGKAMDYFYMNSRGGYNRAFKDFRIQFIRDNFNIFAVVLIIIIAGLIVFTQIRKRRKKKKAIAAGGNK